MRKVKSGELIRFPKGLTGLALSLERVYTYAVIFGADRRLQQGAIVNRTKDLISVPVGPSLLGRVLDALGQPIDAKGSLFTKKKAKIEVKAPGIISRQSVSEPLLTGVLSVDTMIPIGRGQRELIIGDRQTGKTFIAIDTIISQGVNKSINAVIELACIYVAIGQKRSAIAKIVARLYRTKALRYTTVVLAGASDPASLQFLAPYAGCTMAE